MKIKYTKNGKKVAILKKLNKNQSMVQEIIILNNKEVLDENNIIIDNFNLFDDKVKTWKEKNIEEIEKEYEKKLELYNKKNKELENKEKTTIRALDAKIKSLEKYIDTDILKAFKMVSCVLTDKFRYIISDCFSPDIKKFNFLEDVCYFDSYYCEKQFEDLRLLSLFGNSKGDLFYKINKYNDGSGSDTKIFLFKTLKEAKEKLKELYENKKSYDDETIEIYKKHNLTFNKEKLKKYKQEQINFQKELIEQTKKQLNDQVKKLKNIRRSHE
jgi:hypothetical protein